MTVLRRFGGHYKVFFVFFKVLSFFGKKARMGIIKE
jgi:hypothetical protein